MKLMGAVQEVVKKSGAENWQDRAEFKAALQTKKEGFVPVTEAQSMLYMLPEVAEDFEKRDDAAIALRARGFTFREIAEVLGYASARVAQTAYTAGIRRYVERQATATDRAEMRALELERYYYYFHILQPGIDAKDLGCMAMGLRISEAVRKLMGLDIPVLQRQEVTGPGGGPLQIAAVDLSRLSDEDLAAYERLCRQLADTTADSA